MLTDEQTQIRDAARIFARAEIIPFAADWDRDHGAPRSIYRAMAEIGLMGVTIDPRYGGAGADFVSYALAIEKTTADLALGDGKHGRDGLSSIVADAPPGHDNDPDRPDRIRRDLRLVYVRLACGHDRNVPP